MGTPRYFNDGTPMPWGKHRGTKMANVPADYLVWLYDQGSLSGPLRDYIEIQIDDLRKEAQQNKNQK